MPLFHDRRVPYPGSDDVEGGLTLVDEDTKKQKVFQIVGETEADVKSGKVSITSPTGRALIGKKAGDSVEVNTPGGGKSYEIVKVAYI